MIYSNFLRLGLILRQWALQARLDTDYNQALFATIVSKYQSNAKAQMYFRPGRAKLEDMFPCVSFEIQDDKRPYAATNYTKDVTIRFTVRVNVKNSGGKTTPGGDKGILVTEDYCMELAELVREILNEPQTQQITIVKDQDGNTLSAPIHVYESRADDIIYTYGYNGAIRIAEIPWYGKFYLLGPTNPTPSTIPP